MDKVYTQSDYSKAYYNQRKRKKAEVSLEYLTPDLANFIFKHNPREYREIYGDNLLYLTDTSTVPRELKGIYYVVIRNVLGDLKAYFRYGTNNLVGDIKDMEFTSEQLEELKIYGVDINEKIKQK